MASKSERSSTSYDQKTEKVTLRWLIIVPGGLITSPRGGPGGPGTGFCSPGGGFSGSRRSGKPLRLLRLKKTPPGLQKPIPGPPGPPGGLVISPPGTIISHLKVLVVGVGRGGWALTRSSPELEVRDPLVFFLIFLY